MLYVVLYCLSCTADPCFLSFYRSFVLITAPTGNTTQHNTTHRVYSYSNCNFLARYVTLSPEYSSDDVMAACTNLGYDALGQAGAEICSSLLQDHGIGFDYWQATIPVNQHVCTTYLQPTPWGLVSPDLDTAFQAARVFSIIG